MHKPLVSIIVPVYNVEQYLSACLDSILAQTLKDLEVICVDDGSTDKSPAILDDYAKKDSRVRVIHKENRGYGHSMNVGIDAAFGEYIGIVESDDCVLPDMYEKLFWAAKNNDLDVVKSDVILWWGNLNYSIEYYKKYLDKYYNRILDGSYRKVFFEFFMNTWTGIYKKSFLDENQIRHNESPGASYQDNGFWMQTLSYCKRAMWLRDAFYMYRQDNPAASIKSKGKVTAMIKEYEYIEKILRENNKLYELDICHMYRTIRHKGVFLRIADELKREYCENIIRDFEQYKGLLIEKKDIFAWMERLCSDPDRFCDECIRAKQMVLHKLEEAEHIIIYGATKYGQQAMRILAGQGMGNKIMCFAVSEKKAAADIGVLPVHCIDDLTDYRNNSVVVMGVTDDSKSYGQIKLRLRELQFDNVINLSYLQNYFYYIY